MKLLAILAVSITLCAGTPISLTPGDNSNYVEGESRYIWMPDGKGVPHLVDLQESADPSVLMARNGANNRYLLFTRQNPTTPQVLLNGDINTLLSSNFVASKPLKVVVHGWNGDESSSLNALIVNAFLTVYDCNVIYVDWGHLANSNYISAVLGVPSIGQYLGNFLVWLVNTSGANWNNVHLVGHSLGAHVIGNAGRTTGNRPARLTGLDPAGPLWGSSSNALRASDGQYVEAIHTDGGLLGINDPIGNANFYPNGGKNPQPGCWISTCSHGRSYEFFASTIYTNHLIGRQCSSLEEANKNSCTGSSFDMGNGILTKTGSGLYALSTSSSWPY